MHTEIKAGLVGAAAVRDNGGRGIPRRQGRYRLMHHLVMSRLAIVIAIVMSASAAAAETFCDTAKRGTFASNVCWLVDQDPRGRSIQSADPETCTVVVKNAKSSSGTKPSDTTTMRFNESSGSFDVRQHGHMTCWILYRMDGARLLFGCRPRTERRHVTAAIRNLYSKFCTTTKPEY